MSIFNRREYYDSISSKVVELYQNGNTGVKIAKMFGISNNTASKILKENNIKIKGREGYHKYSFNEHYFDKVDTQDKAYWLGWLFSDGYNNEADYDTRLQLQEGDKSVLENFKKSLNYTGPIRFTKNRQWLIILTSKHFSRTLASLGCVQAKSLILKFPNITPRLIRHFIRGYFEGDGCISGRRETGNFKMTIISTKEFCDVLNFHLSKIVGIKNLEKHPNNDITKRYNVSGRRQILKIYKFLYKGSNLALLRKKNKMEELACI